MPLSIRGGSYNLRYDSRPDNKTVKESLAALPNPLRKPAQFYSDVRRERPWSERRIRVWQQLAAEHLDIIGFQEALHRQVLDLHELLNLDGNEFSYAGVGRDDGKTRGEYSPVFWRSSRFDLVSTDSFWLSRTHRTPSKFPGAGSTRVCTVVRLRPKGSSGPLISVMSTHLDDQSEEQRKYGAAQMLLRARYEEHVHGASVLLFGDFNSTPDGHDSGAYNVSIGAIPGPELEASFAKEYSVPSSAPDFRLLDLRGETPTGQIEGHFATYTGWSDVNSSGPYKRIDFIFAGSNSKVRSLSYKVAENLTDDGCYASDHRLVIASLEL